MLSCYLKVGEQYGKPTLSLPFGGLQNKYGACAGLTPDQPTKRIAETTIIKGREFPLRLRNDKRTVDRGAWGLGDSFRAGRKRKTPGGEAGLGVGGETRQAPLVGRLCCC